LFSDESDSENGAVQLKLFGQDTTIYYQNCHMCLNVYSCLIQLVTVQLHLVQFYSLC